MAKFIVTGKGRKRFITALSILLSASLSLGIVSACNPTEENPDDEDDTTVSATDTQLLKNGNFEFYSEMDEKERDDRRAFISSPNDWSFSSGSPSSDTASGIIDTAHWQYMTASTHKLIPAEPEKDADGNELEHTLTDAVIADATSHWEEASVYDRLEFYDYYDIDSASEFELYGDYRYSNDFEDLEYLHEVANSADKPLLYAKEGREEDSSILMIHNHRTSDGVRGTAQYYTSSTTVTLNAGTAAKVSVWVRTSELYHYAATAEGENDIPVEKRAGAYIGITNTVGGTTLDQMQIKNINTKDAWQQYTVYIRANSFATTTFRVVLGLGQGSSDNRYEAVDGYAFFDDVTCDVISETEYNNETKDFTPDNSCDLNSKGDEKKFYAIDSETGAQTANMVYALDLNKTDEISDLDLSAENDLVNFGLTQEVSGSKTYTSASIDPALSDTSKADGYTERNNIAGLMSLEDIKTTTNGYLKTIYKNDFAEKFPFDSEENIVMLLSTNGAAYTATVSHPEFSLQPKDRILISFFVKTSNIPSGKTGASAILVDGENENTISAFNSTTVAAVDIDANSDDPAMKDIYKGWVRCFFFVENNTEEEKTFTLKLTYGPTAIASTSKTDYTDGYAAFANFKICPLTKAQYGYAATGTYAQKVSLTATVKDDSKFDDASANGPTLEQGLSIPVSYTGVLAGSNVLVESQKDNDGNITNKNPDRETLAVKHGIYAGLLSAEQADKYLELDVSEQDVSNQDYLPNLWMNTLNNIAGDATAPDEWWKNIFGNKFGTEMSNVDAAYQPLVILNTAQAAAPSYGFFASSANVAANAASRISVRVKLSEGATATVYLTDVSSENKADRLGPTLPAVTYWYDDDGNIVSGDPAAEDFDETEDILYTREPNGLYKKAGDTSGVYYANLSSFETDDKGNLVTTDGTIAYYGHEGKFYAYYDKDTDQYTQEVVNLPATDGVRYNYAGLDKSKYEAKLTVTGTADNAGKWVTLTFYVNGGNAAKDYRLELWAGDRGNTANGLPEGGYVFFDRCKTETASNYDAMRDASVEALKDSLGVADDENLPETDDNGNALALYYTFTFFDSPEYLRYDETQDEEKLGDPWGSYEQSSHTEQLMWLLCNDEDGTLLGTGMPSVTVFMSYGENEVTVTPDDLGSTDDSTDTDTDTDDNSGLNNGGNIWLLLSSILLAAALIFAVCVLAFRRLWKKYHRTSAKAPKKAKAPKPAKGQTETEAPAEEPAPAPAPAKPSKKQEPRDENDPYNE